jgi:hypothetical protein
MIIRGGIYKSGLPGRTVLSKFLPLSLWRRDSVVVPAQPRSNLTTRDHANPPYFASTLLRTCLPVLYLPMKEKS